MIAIDLDVRISIENEIPKFLEMAQALGYSAIGSTIFCENKDTELAFPVYTRINLKARKLSALKKQATDARFHCAVVAVPLQGVETTNWAAEDSRIDLLTIDPLGNHSLRKTTANISATNETALEVCIAPLLTSIGLDRSRIIRSFHDSIVVALHAGMKIILTSGADLPIHMRSPVALRHIGMMLGLSRKEADDAILSNPKELVSQNIKRSSGDYIGPGVELLSGDR
ncbi:MAG: RNase P subunit p30 family protein [Candidatus Thorarchaeota archaeon]